MDKSIKPKWRSYGEFTSLLEVGTSDTAVLVEDAASACAVYATGTHTGVALLGTSLTLRQRKLLEKYANVIVCLDKDASKKAITIRGQLRGTTNACVKFLHRDLKYMKKDQIMELMDESSSNYIS
jgi:DNA primase